MDHSVQELQAEHEQIVQDAVPACGGRPKPDGEEDPAGEVGWFLQREREKRGLSLEAVGEEIGVHPYHIEAIEYGDMTCMPQRVEALQMISAYADFLGFHPEPLLEHYVKIMPVPQVAPKVHPAAPAPLSSARVFSFSKHLPKSLPQLNIKLPTMKMDNNGIVASVAAAFMLFAGTTWLMAPSKQATEAINVAVQMPAVDEPMPAATTGDDAAKVKVTDLEVTDDPLSKTDDMAVSSTADAAEGDPLGAFIKDQVGTDAAATTASVDTAVAPPAEEQVAMVEPTKTDGAKVFGDANASARLVITAKAPVWVRIEDAQGNVVITQMFNTGDSFRVPDDRKGLVVIARDGSHLTYSVDGQERGVLGKPGEILAGEELDADKLLAKG